MLPRLWGTWCDPKLFGTALNPWFCRLLLFMIGFYYPLYFLQLDASEHNLSNQFSFYSVEFRPHHSFKTPQC